MRNLLFVIIITFIVTFLSGTHLAIAQTPTPREEAEALIRGYAVNDARNGVDEREGLALTINSLKNHPSTISEDEIANIYRKEYRLANQIIQSPTFKFLQNIKLGAILLAGFMLGLLVQYIEEASKPIFEELGKYIFNFIISLGIFRHFVLRRYLKNLLEFYMDKDIPFRKKKVKEVTDYYIPLDVQIGDSISTISIDEYIDKHHNMVILGNPGAGKSTILTQQAIRYATGWFDGSRRLVPVLVKLNLLNNEYTNLTDLIIHTLKQHKMPGNAIRYLQKQFEEGKLVLMFDGFDEVIDPINRRNVIRDIKRFLEENIKYNSKIIITCRKAVYKKEFNQYTAEPLTIQDLTDEQTRRFLRTWQDEMRYWENKWGIPRSPDQLMKSLEDRPQIKLLARNPLILLITTALYTYSQNFKLPHSRSEFYTSTTSDLLGNWDKSNDIPNIYPGDLKRQVLHRLAYGGQHTHNPGSSRVFSRDEVVLQILETTRNTEFRDDDPKLMLQEIVNRSGLLISVIEGDSYQFAHYSLQQFFAAVSLKEENENPNIIVKLYQNNRNSWLEPIKMLCGLYSYNSRDCGEIIQLIMQVDAVDALACLGEAKGISTELQEAVMESAKALFGQRPDVEDAFAVIASNTVSEFGRTAYSFLRETLINDRNPIFVNAAVTALSKTDLPQAAELLNEHRGRSSYISQALIQMGDIAVSIFKERARLENRKESWKNVVALNQIKTMAAKEALVDLLWAPHSRVATLAAWYLAIYLREPEIEQRLGKYYLAKEFREDSTNVNWVWQPFQTNNSKGLNPIVGRIVHLLSKANPRYLPKNEICPDPRILIPLCAIILTPEPREAKESLARRHQNGETLWGRLIGCIDSRVADILSHQFAVTGRFFMPRKQFRSADWVQIGRERYFSFKGSLYYRLCIVINGFLVIIGFSRGIYELISLILQYKTHITQLPQTTIFFGIFVTFTLIGMSLRSIQAAITLAKYTLILPYILFQFLLTQVTAITDTIYQLQFGAMKDDLIRNTIISILFTILTFTTITQFMGFHYAIIIFLTIMITYTIIWFLGTSKDRENPLHKLAIQAGII